MMIRRFIFVMISVALFMGAATSEAAGKNKAKAKKHFKAGVALIESDDFDSAAVEFEESVNLHPTKMGFFNLANCYKALHRYAEALATIKRLEGSFGKKLNAELRNVVNDFKEEIQNIVAELSIVVSHPGAKIVFDGEQVGISPMGKPLIIAPGVHSVTVTLNSFAPVTKKTRIVSGDITSLRFELVPEQESVITPIDSSASSSKPEKEEEEPEKPKRVWTWVALGLGVGSAIGAGVTGGLALGKAKDVEGMCDGNICPVEAQDPIDKVGSLNLATDILMGVAVVGVVATIILYFVEPDDELNESNVSVMPIALQSGGGAVIGGRF